MDLGLRMAATQTVDRDGERRVVEIGKSTQKAHSMNGTGFGQFAQPLRLRVFGSDGPCESRMRPSERPVRIAFPDRLEALSMNVPEGAKPPIQKSATGIDIARRLHVKVEPGQRAEGLKGAVVELLPIGDGIETWRQTPPQGLDPRVDLRDDGSNIR